MSDYLPQVGDIAEGTVVRVYPRYAILLFEEGWTGLLHISELSTSYIRNFVAFVAVGNIYAVKVIAVDKETGGVRVSLKQMTQADRHKSFRHHKIDLTEIDFQSLEDKLPEWVKAQLAEGEQP